MRKGVIYHDDKDKDIPSLVQYIEVNYLESMKPKPMPMPNPKRSKLTKGGKGTKRRMNGRKNKKTKKRY